MRRSTRLTALRIHRQDAEHSLAEVAEALRGVEDDVESARVLDGVRQEERKQARSNVQELLAKREDGYHEVRSVIQTVDIADVLTLEAAPELTLDDVPGLGPARRAALLKHFGSVRKISAASVADIAALPGFGPALAEAVVGALAGTRGKIENT